MKNVIYQILNLIDGKRYIGSARNFVLRKRDHLRKFEARTHENKHLQRAWNKYGKESFVFEIIDSVRYKEELLDREYYWFSKYDFKTELYNILPIPGSHLGAKRSKKSRERLSESQPYKRSVVQIDKNTGEIIAIHESVSSAARATGTSGSHVSSACSQTPHYRKDRDTWNIRKTAGGFVWRFAENIDLEKGKIEIKTKLARAGSKPVMQIDKDTNKVIAIHQSIHDAGRATGVRFQSISHICNQTPLYHKKQDKYYTSKTAGGFKWQFANKDETALE